MMLHGMGRKSAALFAAVGLLAVVASSANAGFTVTLDSGSPTGSGPYTYTYTAAIPSGDVINPGDYFRIYDFAGYVSGSVSAPAGWTASFSNSNPTPPPSVLLNHVDDPSLPNITFTYNGPSPIVGAASIDNFSAQSLYGLPGTVKDFVGRDSKANTPTGVSFVDSVGDLRVPSVPEPSALLSCSVGAIVLLGYLTRARRKV